MGRDCLHSEENFCELGYGYFARARSKNNIGADNLYTQTNASFGDGFRHSTSTGSPFVWGGDSRGRFTIDLSGSISSSRGLESLNAGAFVLLALYQPNTLDPAANLVGVPNLIAYYFYLLGNPNQHIFSCDFAGHCAELVSSGFYSSFPAEITQDITPEGDFDWALLLGASGSTTSVGDYDIDFSHTLTLSYQGPAGSTVQSVSGTFANISAVPEPSTPALLLLLTVIAGTLARARRRL